MSAGPLRLLRSRFVQSVDASLVTPPSCGAGRQNISGGPKPPLPRPPPAGPPPSPAPVDGIARHTSPDEHCSLLAHGSCWPGWQLVWHAVEKEAGSKKKPPPSSPASTRPV